MGWFEANGAYPSDQWVGAACVAGLLFFVVWASLGWSKEGGSRACQQVAYCLNTVIYGNKGGGQSVVVNNVLSAPGGDGDISTAASTGRATDLGAEPVDRQPLSAPTKEEMSLEMPPEMSPEGVPLTPSPPPPLPSPPPPPRYSNVYPPLLRPPPEAPPASAGT